MKNRFNNLTSKEWLPFQKSWFLFSDYGLLFVQNILFFTQIKQEESYFPRIVLDSDRHEIYRLLQKNRSLEGREIIPFDRYSGNERIDFVVFDVTNDVEKLEKFADFVSFLIELRQKVRHVISGLAERKFILILARNKCIDGVFYPFAWLLAKYFQQILSLKDEKVGIDLNRKLSSVINHDHGMATDENIIYALYFRKDEMASMDFTNGQIPEFQNRRQAKTAFSVSDRFPSYQIVKPPPRKKDEILHPAKYPEVLIQSFIAHFTKSGDNVFDPMSGTGSTQLAALSLGRNAYGTELSTFFADIARQRCAKSVSQGHLFKQVTNRFHIKTKDARQITKDDFPEIHYIITSPPYWDMLNMKGAENQAKRRQKGLPTNYSNSENDLGNIADYRMFLRKLTDIYFRLYDLLVPGRYMTIIVKNIKKKGRNFPLAWDLSLALSKKYILCPETFWFQDDLRIAPYGYGNTWVSNTFHHYCLTFQKPVSGL